MTLSSLQQRHYRVELITEHYFLAGALEPFGMLMPYLNNIERKNILLKQVTAAALDVTSTISTFHADELWVRQAEIAALRLLDRVSSETMPLSPFKQKLRIFLPRFLVQGIVSRGQDTKLADIFEAMSGMWVAVTEALVHPLLPTKCQVFREAELLLIHKSHIRYYLELAEKDAS